MKRPMTEAEFTASRGGTPGDYPGYVANWHKHNTGNTTTATTAKAEFEALVSKLVSDGMTTSDAIMQVARERPALHARYIADANK